MNFVDSITNYTQTQNGALTHKSAGSALLDLFSMGVSDNKNVGLIQAAMRENFIEATKIIMYLRDCRGGQGNRDILRTYLSLAPAELVNRLIPYLPEIGRWKDIVELYNPDTADTIFRTCTLALGNKNGLCAKWMPRQGKFARNFAKHLDISHGEYRRMVVQLSKTVEQQMCAKEWHNINYSQVPSLANRKYAEAFKKHDWSRYELFINKANAGEVTMNSGQLYPHEIVSMLRTSPYHYSFSANPTADALWKNLPNYMEKAVNVLPVIDTSGSMFSTAYGSHSCISVAVGLGLYLASHNTGNYKDVWCNFSSAPNFYKLQGTSLSQQVASLDYHNWSMSTNIEAVFDMILANSTAEDIPKMILIVSDMEFNCVRNYSTTNYQNIKNKYAAAGLEMPILVFWRVNVKISQQPVTKDEKGTILINGYSPAIMKNILNMDLDDLESLTPMNVMKTVISSDRYSFVDTIFAEE